MCWGWRRQYLHWKTRPQNQVKAGQLMRIREIKMGFQKFPYFQTDSFIHPVSVKPDYEENWARVSPIIIKSQTNNLEFQPAEIVRVKLVFFSPPSPITSPHHKNKDSNNYACILLASHCFFSAISWTLLWK